MVASVRTGQPKVRVLCIVLNDRAQRMEVTTSYHWHRASAGPEGQDLRALLAAHACDDVPEPLDLHWVCSSAVRALTPRCHIDFGRPCNQTLQLQFTERSQQRRRQHNAHAGHQNPEWLPYAVQELPLSKGLNEEQLCVLGHFDVAPKFPGILLPWWERQVNDRVSLHDAEREGNTHHRLEVVDHRRPGVRRQGGVTCARHVPCSRGSGAAPVTDSRVEEAGHDVGHLRVVHGQQVSR
mmetsp:Transcript_5687/g.12954  ORF Transcript_5687/g.12954 Transcript_5687/m.12954 type:complete len:238 (-) Transcript_5687:4114-4827(-)